MINAACDEVIPRRCTEKLAEALGIADRVVWLDGLGHYTAVAELPRALRMTADFFGQDLAKGAGAKVTQKTSPVERLASVVQEAVAMLTTEPQPGHCDIADVEFVVIGCRSVGCE